MVFSLAWVKIMILYKYFRKLKKFLGRSQKNYFRNLSYFCIINQVIKIIDSNYLFKQIDSYIFSKSNFGEFECNLLTLGNPNLL